MTWLNASNGGLILPRTLLHSPLWHGLTPEQQDTVLDILALAKTEETTWVAGNRVLQPGQVIYNMHKDSPFLSGRQTQLLLDKLQGAGIISRVSVKGGAGGGYTLITVNNWELYSDHEMYDRISKGKAQWALTGLLVNPMKHNQ